MLVAMCTCATMRWICVNRVQVYKRIWSVVFLCYCLATCMCINVYVCVCSCIRLCLLSRACVSSSRARNEYWVAVENRCFTFTIFSITESTSSKAACCADLRVLMSKTLVRQTFACSLDVCRSCTVACTYTCFTFILSVKAVVLVVHLQYQDFELSVHKFFTKFPLFC